MISADQIRESFFRADVPNLQAATEADDCRMTRASLTGESSIELTPTSRHILRLARKQLATRAYGEDNNQSRLPRSAELERLVLAIEAAEVEQLSDLERTSVVAALESCLEDFDILSPLIGNPKVNDIIVRSFNDVSIQIDRHNHQTDYRFPDPESYRSFVENLLKRVGKSCTTSTPVVDAAIGSNIRLCVTHESFSPPGCGPMLTIRISRHGTVSLSALGAAELAPPIILEYLSTLIRNCVVTMLVSGEVGTGKTTLVRALATSIEPEESILIIEDTHEIVLERPFVRTLLTREANTEGAGRIEPAAAIRTGMRMAMNRLILGEIRDARAAESFVDVCSSGHSGMSTIHARSARDSLARLELFLARAQGGVCIDTIRREIANAVSVIVHLGLDRAHRRRRVLEIVEVAAFSDGAIQQLPMFTFVQGEAGAAPRWRRESGISQYDEALRRKGLRLPVVGTTVEL